MHTRRLAAFFLGAWLLGTFFTMFVAQRNMRAVDRVLSSPPGAVARDIEEMGQDVTRQLLRYQAVESNRDIEEIWAVVQIGLAAALLSAAVLTAHRSRFLIIIASLMMLISLIEALYILPALKGLGRAIDFLPETANSPERESFQAYSIWRNVLRAVIIISAAVGAGRLLFDRYGWGEKLLPDTGRSSHHGRRRRRKRTSDGSVVHEQPQPEEPPEAEPVEGADRP